MSNFEGTRRQRLEWIEARIDQWQANAAAIGITPAQATNLKNLVGAATSMFTAAEVARDNAKSATRKFYDAMSSMSGPTRDLIATIKAYAETTNNPNVYNLSNIDPPAPPTPVRAPSAPFDVSGFVSPTGNATITWDADRSGASTGVFFMVERKRGSEATFMVIGGTAEKSYLDLDPRLATGTVQYRVKAQRGGLSSEWSVPIAFSIVGGGGGGFTVSQVSDGPGESVQLAA
jgi:hypothetical protein